jgi:hypothetical protein
MFWKSLFNQLVVNQAQRGGEEGRFPRSHSSDVINQQLGILFGKPFMEEPYFHIEDCFVTEGGPGEKSEWTKPLDVHLAAKEEKSSCVMLDVESLDWISFSASPLIFLISSFFFPRRQH